MIHPFNDGQKRTGFQVADIILRSNGLRMSGYKEEICDFFAQNRAL